MSYESYFGGTAGGGKSILTSEEQKNKIAEILGVPPEEVEKAIHPEPEEEDEDDSDDDEDWDVEDDDLDDEDDDETDEDEDDED